MTPVPESGTRRDPIEPSVGHAVFTNLMACSRCDGCGELSIGSLWTGDVITAHDAPEIAAVVTDPHPSPSHGGIQQARAPRSTSDVPAKIAAAASEANSRMTVDAFRGAVLLARSVIKATAKDKGMTGKGVVTKIDARYEARLIREDIRDGAHEVRYLANDAAHGDFAGPAPQADAELILNLMNEVLEEVLPPSLFETSSG